MPSGILIVDDHELVRRALRTILEARLDCVCAEAENGLQALEKVVEFKPNLVILDLAMPVLDGLSAARLISAVSADVPILLYTSHAFSGLEAEAKKNGVLTVVNKTAPPDELVEFVRTLLEEPERAHASGRRRSEVAR